MQIDNIPDNTTHPTSKLKQFGWLILLWGGSVVSLLIVVMIIRFFMTMAGLKS